MRTLACLALLFVCMSACSSTPDVRYYRIAIEQKSPATPRTKFVVGVEDFSASPAYDDVRIVYRQSPYRLDYYHYHRWSAPPSVLVTDAVRAMLQQGGQFKGVHHGFSTDTDVMLSGRVIAFEEVDLSSSKWQARVVLNLSVRRTKDSALLWSGALTKTQPLASRNPEGLAKGMTMALRALSKDIESLIIKKINTSPKPNTPAATD